MDLSNVDWELILQRGGTILVIWLIIFLARALLIRLSKMANQRIDLIDLSESDFKSIFRIIDIALAIIGLGLTLSVLRITSIESVGIWGPRIIALAFTWIVVWILVQYLSRWIEMLDEKIEGFDIESRDLKTLDRLLDGVVVLIGVIISLAILDVTSLLYSALTAAGVFSVIIGFALQDIGANMISGIFLLIDRPFVVGDAINVKNYSGTVNKISLRTTEIITFDGPVVCIPNNTMTVEPVTNYSLSQSRRVLFTVSVLNTADLNLAIKTIQETLDDEKRLLPDKPPSILVNQIREYAVEFQVIAYTSKEDIFVTQSDLQKEIVDRFAQQNIELAVPVRVNINGLDTIHEVRS